MISKRMRTQAEQEEQPSHYLRMELERVSGDPRRINAVFAIFEKTRLGEETATGLGRSIDRDVGDFHCHGYGGDRNEDCGELHVNYLFW